MTIAAGAKLGSYEVLAPIGAGGMGEVYQAHDSKLGRDVAIKVSISFNTGTSAVPTQREAEFSGLKRGQIVTMLPRRGRRKWEHTKPRSSQFVASGLKSLPQP
jgi:serine/threonine protein kinase